MTWKWGSDMNTPQRINLVEVQTIWGFRAFELYQGDITQLQDVDILFVSAFSKTYVPLSGSVIGALHNIGIDVQQLAQQPLLDLREPLNCWVSTALPQQPFKHIVCVEMPFDVAPQRDGNDTDQIIRQALKDLFTVLWMLEARDIPATTVATPMLATNLQNYNPHTVIKTLLELSTRHLEHSSTTATIKFVAYDKARADDLRHAMDDILGRVRVQLPRGPQIDALKRDILELLRELRKQIDHPVFDDVQQLARENPGEPLNYGITGRDFAQAFAEDLLGTDNFNSKDDLIRKINKLQKPQADVPEWLKPQLHLLRTIGNDFAHGQGKTISAEDMELQLMCIRRILKFWIAYYRKNV
jgi:O-acetyl-ADP-ribose deacetylase (regulator of RNase III)